MSDYYSTCCVPECDRPAFENIYVRVQTKKGLVDSDCPFCQYHAVELRKQHGQTL